MTDEMTPPRRYVSLDEIRQRKSELRLMLRNDSEQMKTKAHTLFHRDEDENLPSRRFAGLMTKSATFIDGAILVWKLYQKFHNPGKKSSKKSGFSFFSSKKKKKRR